MVNGKKVTKKQVAVLCQAVSYADAEKTFAELCEEEAFVNPTTPEITSFPYHEILGYRADVHSNWWKFRLKYVSEDDGGKISIFYVRYLAYADDVDKALAIVHKKEVTSAVLGEIEAINITTIDYMLITEDQMAAA